MLEPDCQGEPHEVVLRSVIVKYQRAHCTGVHCAEWPPGWCLGGTRLSSKHPWSPWCPQLPPPAWGSYQSNPALKSSPTKRTIFCPSWVLWDRPTQGAMRAWRGLRPADRPECFLTPFGVGQTKASCLEQSKLSRPRRQQLKLRISWAHSGSESPPSWGRGPRAAHWERPSTDVRPPTCPTRVPRLSGTSLVRAKGCPELCGCRSRARAATMPNRSTWREEAHTEATEPFRFWATPSKQERSGLCTLSPWIVTTHLNAPQQVLTATPLHLKTL